MRNYTDTMIEIASWVALKAALYKAADSYFNDPSARKSRGIFHGDTGIFRAQNLMRITAPANDISNGEIFILLSAIFNSSSGLAFCVAEELFSGAYESHFIVGSESWTKDTLGSTVFSPEFVIELKCNSNVLKRESDGEVWLTDRFDKLSVAQFVINDHFRKYENGADFSKQVRQTMTMLEKKPGVEEVQMRTLKTTAAC